MTMLTFQDGKDVFRIRFIYPQQEPRKSRVVVCEIGKRPMGQHVAWEATASGVSRCNPVDVFTKEEGRKRSLANAVKQYPRKVRTAAWRAYWDRLTKDSKPANLVFIR